MNASEKLIVGQQYARADLYEVLEVPLTKRRGNWETGYNQYNGEYFVFVNVETPGRTGHNYNDAWERCSGMVRRTRTRSSQGSNGCWKTLLSAISSRELTTIMYTSHIRGSARWYV